MRINRQRIHTKSRINRQRIHTRIKFLSQKHVALTKQEELEESESEREDEDAGLSRDSSKWCFFQTTTLAFHVRPRVKINNNWILLYSQSVASVFQLKSPEK